MLRTIFFFKKNDKVVKLTNKNKKNKPAAFDLFDAYAAAYKNF
ncbi:hypothetical protein [Metabacillus fastidiosus]|uniref:Uncharacterized protein n=1 Tax=Metabacillus fastidiosus TaxID=1458 RepID=A0ABU6NWK3_9BACI|nr:hypothetical protein [Metabacillus fastidiosus]MED4401401.1 hypothetical protein [Metabacillus fastidiosus]MED4453033.1 hypothetical protein [Metabacillus fastidiosus]MED4463036.1 hypothetical protein [Metabacillus fastidiosus]MED4532383.1 hypothetical protein [Metabacillus fastidiosus]